MIRVLTHPRTGRPFDSPVPPGSGWPGDPATAATPVARGDADVVELAARLRDELSDLKKELRQMETAGHVR